MDDTSLADVVPPGTVLADKYEVVRLLGRGGMGVVLEARHLRLGQMVAIKLLRSSVRSMSEVMMRFEREGRAAARLTGPHVARILDVDALPDGRPFMVMELLRGRELGEELTAQGKLPIRTAVGYILQACAAMAEAHRAGIVHRDLKPSNLFLAEENGRRIVKVLDFGISKLVDDVHASMTTTASAFGTPLYMSPEQVRSAKHVDARSDVWSLGVVLYELLAGEPPFLRDSATAILAAIVAERPARLDEKRRDVPSGLSKAVMKALEKEPAARFADVQDFAAAIAPYGPPKDDPDLATAWAELSAPRAARSKVASAMTSPPGDEASRGRPAQRWPWLVAALGVLCATGAVLVLASPWSPRTGPDPAATAQGASSSAATPPASAPTPPSSAPAPPVETAAPAPVTAAPAQGTAAPSVGSSRPTAAPSAAGSSAPSSSAKPRPTSAPSVTPTARPTVDPVHL